MKKTMTMTMAALLLTSQLGATMVYAQETPISAKEVNKALNQISITKASWDILADVSSTNSARFRNESDMTVRLSNMLTVTNMASMAGLDPLSVINANAVVIKRVPAALMSGIGPTVEYVSSQSNYSVRYAIFRPNGTPISPVTSIGGRRVFIALPVLLAAGEATNYSEVPMIEDYSIISVADFFLVAICYATGVGFPLPIDTTQIKIY